MTGVTMKDECKQAYEDMKLKKVKQRFLVFAVEGDGKSIGIEAKGETTGKTADFEQEYEAFKKALPEEEPRYAVCDVEYQTDDGRPQAKLVFFLWVPDTCATKKKMLYAASKDALKKNLQGLSAEIQANDRSDLDLDEVKKSCMKK